MLVLVDFRKSTSSKFQTPIHTQAQGSNPTSTTPYNYKNTNKTTSLPSKEGFFFYSEKRREKMKNKTFQTFMLVTIMILSLFVGFVMCQVAEEMERLKQQEIAILNPTDWHNDYLSNEISREEIELAKKEYTELYGDTPRNMTKEEQEYAKNYTAALQAKISQK